MVARASILALLLLALAAAACGGGGDGRPNGGDTEPARPTGGLLTIKALEWAFDPPAIELRQGDRVRFVFENAGRSIHNFTIDDLDAADVQSESTGAIRGKEGQLFVGAEKGDRGTLEFSALESGTFTYYCSIPRHRSLGMEGTLTVVP